MTDLSGLELRKKACEALGWKANIATPENHIVYAWKNPHGYPALSLPAIESDSAVSEPMFLEWCEKNGYFWTVAYRRRGLEFQVFLWHTPNWYYEHTGRMDGPQIDQIEARGSTPSEARARAIVAATEKP